MTLGFSLAAPLGPVNMEMIKKSLQSKFGFVLGIVTGMGAMTGDFLIASTVLYVGDKYLRNIVEKPSVYITLLLLNIGILTYIGFSALKSSTEEIPEDEMENPMGLNIVVRQVNTGFIIVVTSPWSYFWWTSFGGYIINSGIPLETVSERLLVTGIFLLGIFVWVLSFCILLGVSQRLASPRILNAITNISALLILGFAIKIAYDGSSYIIAMI